MNSKKENRKSNSNILVPAKRWRQAHPFNLDCRSDSYYSRLATRLTGTIRRMLGDKKELAYTDSDVINIAVTLAAYLEDKVTGTNVFNAFRALYAERFGGVMPFYEADPELIFDDEPNEVEVRFLVWQTVDRINPYTLIDPLAEPVRLMAAELFEILADEYETAPDSPELFDWLFVSADYADPIEMRQRCTWLFNGCYLTHISPDSADRVLDHLLKETGSAAKHLPPTAIYYYLDSVASVTAKTGPLALTAPEWLAKLIDLSGHADRLPADTIRHVDYRSLSSYKVVSTPDVVDDNAIFTAADLFGHQLSVSYNTLQPENRKLIVAGTAFTAALFRYGDAWFINGFLRPHEDPSSFDRLAEKYVEAERDSEERLANMLKSNGGLRYGTARDWTELGDRLGNDPLHSTESVPGNIVNGENFFFFIGSDREVSLSLGGAHCVAFEGNDLYDRTKATKEASRMVLSDSYPREMSDYLIEHSMLPDARLETSAMPDDEAKAWFAANARFLSAICHTDRIDPHYA